MPLRSVTRTVTPDAEETVELLLLRQQLTERITELRDQVARSEQERREKDRQLTALLTDQRTKGDQETALRVPASCWGIFGFLHRFWPDLGSGLPYWSSTDRKIREDPYPL